MNSTNDSSTTSYVVLEPVENATELPDVVVPVHRHFRNDLLLAGIFLLTLATVWTLQAGFQIDSIRRKRLVTRRWNIGVDNPRLLNRANADKVRETVLCIVGRVPLSGIFTAIISCAALGYSMREVFYGGRLHTTWYVMQVTKYGFYAVGGVVAMLDGVDTCPYHSSSPSALVLAVAFVIEAASVASFPLLPSPRVALHLATFSAVGCAVVSTVELGQSAPGPTLRLVRCFLTALLGSWYLRMSVFFDRHLAPTLQTSADDFRRLVTIFSWHAAVVLIAIPILAAAVASTVAFCRHRRYLAWQNEETSPKGEDGNRQLLPDEEWAD